MMGTLKHAFYKSAVLLSSVISLSSCASAALQKEGPFRVEVPDHGVIEGGVFYVSVVSKEALSEIVGNFQGNTIPFFVDPSPASEHGDERGPATVAGEHRYRAIVGAVYGATPGETPFVVRAFSGGRPFETKANVTVKEGEFPSEKLSVPPRTVMPSAKDRRQIARDRVALKRAYASGVQSRFWDPPAVLPVESDVTSVFGTSRVYNGKKQNVHLGTDLRARTGTPLRVPLTGKVVIARRLFYTGYTVILDHGYGLFTIYGHLSRLKVKEGQVAKKGSVMGLAGATGRASGPHLHWGAHLHGAKVDPMVLVKALQ